MEEAVRHCERVAAFGPLAPVAGGFDIGTLDLLVHATPVGMAPEDGLPIGLGGLSASTAVVDIVTRPDTPLLKAAATLGCRNAGGSVMVTAQTKAILRFLGFEPAGGAGGSID